jgi:hypothetical protein
MQLNQQGLVLRANGTELDTLPILHSPFLHVLHRIGPDRSAWQLRFLHIEAVQNHSRIQGNDLLRRGQQWIDVDFLYPALVHDQLTESHEQFFKPTDVDRLSPAYSVE